MKNPITFQRRVPSDRVDAYLNAGWQRMQVLGDSTQLERVPLYREIQSGGYERTVSADIRPPFCIQRARINRPLGAHSKDTFFGAVTCDYMGSAEFEGVALSTAMRRIQSYFPLCQTYIAEPMMEAIGDRMFSLRLFGNFDNQEQLDQYIEWLVEIKNNKRAMQEFPRLGLKLNDAQAPDVWLDIDNSVIMSYDKQFMSRLPNHLMSSFQKLDSNVE